MKRMILIIGLFLPLLFPLSAYAVCPLCTVAAGAGLGISRWLGIDDAVSSIWIGGLIVSSGLWLADWVRKKKWILPYPEVIFVSLFFLFTVISLYWLKMIGMRGNTLWGIDKVLLGTVFGSYIFLVGTGVDKWLRITNKGKVYIHYQKVIVPILFLSLASFIFYLITG